MAPRDYKHRRKGGGRKAKPARGWIWFAAGLTVGVVATLGAEFLDYFSAERVVQAVRHAAGGDQTKLAVAQKAKEAKKPSKRPRFEFYTMLPEMEVAVPDAELDRATASPSPGPAEDNVTYVLQAGSFRKLDEADRLKAELALIGMSAQIQTVSIDGGSTWHRVRVGPFTNLQALNEARAVLKRNGLNVIVLKVRS